MPEKENINQQPVDDRTASTADEKKADQPTTVHNPFEGGAKEITQEELDSLEQFKEAQTERD